MSKIILPKDFYEYDYAKLSRSESNSKNRVRLLAMANIKEGMKLEAIGKILKVHWKTIQKWLYRFREEGISGLYVRPTKDKTTKLGPEIEQWISKFLEQFYSSPVGGRITGKQLHKLITEEFCISFSLKTIYNTLKRLKLSWISCRSKHPKSNDEVQELYKKLCRSGQIISPKEYMSKNSRYLSTR